MVEEVKEGVMMLHHTESINKEREITEKNQVEIMKLKSTKQIWLGAQQYI